MFTLYYTATAVFSIVTGGALRDDTKNGCVTAVQFILFNFANYSPSVTMELKASKEITCK